jgi:hypothetical protein
MLRSQIRRAAVLAGLSILTTVAIAAMRPAEPAPPVKGVSYRLRMTTRLPQMMAQMQNGNAAGPAFIAKVKAVGKNARFEFQNVPEGMPVNLDDYLLVLESGRAIMVRPADKSYAEAPASLGGQGGSLGMLGSIAGRGSRESGRQIDITGIDMDLQQLDGDTLQGRQVRHYQLVAEMFIQFMNNNVPLRIEMETWTADLPASIVNPFDISGTVSPDDPAAKLTTRLLAERKKMQGTPIKTIMNMTITLGNGAVPPLEFGQTTQITDIQDLDVNPKDLEVPVGYTKRESETGTGRGRGGPPGF